jgi:hypothetical protein
MSRVPAPVREAFELLQGLVAARVPLVIIGSCALEVRAPGLLDRRPRDVDLLVPPTRTALTSFVAVVTALGGQTFSWGEPVVTPFFPAEGSEHDLGPFAGRWYLRASVRRSLVDATYECPWLPFEQAWAGAAWRHGLPYVAPADQLILNQARDRLDDRALLSRAAQRGLHPATRTAPYSAA